MPRQDVSRSLMDTLGAIALAAVDTPTSSREERHGGSGSGSAPSDQDASSAANRESAATGGGREAPSGVGSTSAGGAFGLAVDELARMCGEDGDGGPPGAAADMDVRGWALLGLPLR